MWPLTGRELPRATELEVVMALVGELLRYPQFSVLKNLLQSLDQLNGFEWFLLEIAQT